jgi:plasmid stabilization system protein ParE
LSGKIGLFSRQGKFPITLRIEVADKFLDKIALKIDRISDYPETGHPTRFKAVRRVRIDKYHSLYYRIQKKKIIILYLWDGRQDPKKNLYGR